MTITHSNQPMECDCGGKKGNYVLRIFISSILYYILEEFEMYSNGNFYGSLICDTTGRLAGGENFSILRGKIFSGFFIDPLTENIQFINNCTQVISVVITVSLWNLWEEVDVMGRCSVWDWGWGRG